MITYSTNTMPNAAIHVRQWTFPGGEVGVDINNPSTMYPERIEWVKITARMQNSDDVMALVMATDAIRRAYPNAVDTIYLYMPYVPYARQDRVMETGQSLSITAFAAIINLLKFKVVAITDPHSAVTPAVLNNVFVSPQTAVFGKVKRSFRDWTIVAPDQGATKKCEEFAKLVGAAGVITCHKTRDLHTGKILGLDVNGPGDMSHLNLFVLDDICDGGRTFTELAALLRRRDPAKMELAVTHGIFSKGVEVVASVYDHVYTTDSFLGAEKASQMFDAFENVTCLRATM